MAAPAAILGTSLIAGEVSKGSIFFLLSKPVSRDRVLLTKYGISALLMLIVALIGTALLFIVGMSTGHILDLSRMLMATLLAWLGALFVLSLTLVCSVLFSDVLRPALVALGVTVVLALPVFLPNWQNWSLVYYWSSADAYFKGDFPLTNLLVNLAAATLPLIAALMLFRRRAY
jgi:ABC-type transport system involved in multi-copper enzyme maturation permease subunit